MANEEHLRLIKQGAEAWNQWRKANPDIEPNFTDADLRHANLSKMDLSNAAFVLADLHWADLSGADLTRASFFMADLTYANLSNSNLERTVLWEANLCNSRCRNATFMNTLFGGTLLGNVDLHNPTGLESCSHDGPSVVDIRTLRETGELPLSFLRGCGFPDALIQFLPTLLSDPGQFYSCFISYSSKNQQFAEKLNSDLQDRGVRCWFAPQDLKWGDETRTKIDESISSYDKVLLIISKQSIASGWVKKEVETAMEREEQQKRIILFPIRLDNAVMTIETGWAADIRRSRNIGDFRKWKDGNQYDESLNRLLRDLSLSP